MNWSGVSDSATGAALLPAYDIEVDCTVRVRLPGAGLLVPAHRSIESADDRASEVCLHHTVRDVTRPQSASDVSERCRAHHLLTATAGRRFR